MTVIQNTVLFDTLTTLFKFPLFKGLTLSIGPNSSDGLQILDGNQQRTKITDAQLRLINRSLRGSGYFMQLSDNRLNAYFTFI